VGEKNKIKAGCSRIRFGKVKIKDLTVIQFLETFSLLRVITYTTDLTGKSNFKIKAKKEHGWKTQLTLGENNHNITNL
jgi:hypothetical protein